MSATGQKFPLAEKFTGHAEVVVSHDHLGNY